MSESNFAKIQVFWNSKLRCYIVKRRRRSQICKLNLWMATTAVASFCQTRKFAKVFFFFFFCFLELRPLLQNPEKIVAETVERETNLE